MFKSWLLKAEELQDPILEVASKAETPQAKLNFLLLGCALQQNITLGELQFFLTELLKITPDVAEVPVLSENQIADVIVKAHLKHWVLYPNVAGIIWSVGRFARARGNRLDLWVKDKSGVEIWKECADIFYMGKNNGIRPKVLWFLFRLSLYGFSHLEPKTATPPLPISAGARRWLIQTQQYNAEETPKEKLKTANLLYGEISPKNPSLACHALQFFSEPNSDNSYFCQKIFPCELCTVSAYCHLHF
ncbi:hypothetical protein AGMMS49938_02220 [Fibrobacterales bacterium]|nr:hypothetical protein AGMMS49938_02220 [Fibrobacterales bacterium]